MKAADKVMDKGEWCLRRIQHITDTWYVREPVLLMTLVSHRVEANERIQTIRCGQGRIEYNRDYVSQLSDEQLETQFKIEVIRILLRHPYRQPPQNNLKCSYIASNITLNAYYPFRNLPYKAADFWPSQEFAKKNFEFYYRELKNLDQDNGADNKAQGTTISNDGNTTTGSGGDTSESDSNRDDDIENTGESTSTAMEKAGLWEEDDYLDHKIGEIISFAQQRMSWGTIPGALRETLIVSLRPVIDYREVLKGFRATILSSEKTLTRFRPSRRYGFMYMGKKSTFTTRLLIGVDVSGSISNEEIDLFYATINRFFKYGIQSLDVLQFDVDITGEPVSMRKARKTIQVTGRGGTHFQPIIDYFLMAKKMYDGLIIFTDGYAPAPEIPAGAARNILWICNSKRNYERHLQWMSKMGRCCWIE
ncbi:MAG: VWA-like domain-containing protein [Treponema sp.]|jgi:predicted metal-dependent peptidase|nr:VWA-like domain-containing protein [Treponema sp.]